MINIHNMTLKWFVISMSIISIFVMSPNVVNAQLNITDELEVSPGVNYERYDESSGESMSTRVMSVDVSQSHLEVGLNIGSPYPNLIPTTSLADQLTQSRQQVIGGINGSFFHFSSERPAYMLAENDRLVNLGAVSSDSDGYMSVPTAFGVMSDGSAKIDSFNMDITYEVNGDTYEVDKYNGERGSNETVLFTPSHKFDWTRTNEYGVEIHVENPDPSIDDEKVEFGETITGEVRKIRRYGSKEYIQQPKDGFVISIHGDTPIDDNLNVGDEVKLNVDIEDQWKNADFVLGSGPQLVKDGQVDLEMDPNSSNARVKNPRTVIGTNRNGSEVHFITVDGRQQGYSEGMTMQEVAEYVQSLGIDHAINLDGGGSTTMVARQYGNTSTSVMNSPSGSYERGVSNGLFAMLTTESNEAGKIIADVSEKGRVLKGSTVDIEIDHVLDEYYNPLNYNSANVDYTVSDQLGRVENGTFIAENAGRGEIDVSYGDASTTIPIEVVGEFDQVTVNPDDMRLGVGETQTFQATPQMNDGSNVIWDESQIEWSTSGNIGDITQQGELTANSISATGEVTATINSQTYSVDVQVGGDDVVLDSFTDQSQWSSTTVRGEGDIRPSSEFEPSVGDGNALRLDYDFTGQSGTSAVYAQYNGDEEFLSKPNEIGAWVFGDNSEHWLRAQLIDASGNIRYLSFTEENELNWSGWEYVTADIPSDIERPYSLNSIYVAETSNDEKDKGFIYLDEVQLSFNGKDASNGSSERATVEPTKEWRITFDQSLDESTVNHNSAYITNREGDSFDVSYDFEQNQEVLILKPEQPLPSGVYQLNIKNVESQEGHEINGNTVKPFVVE